MGPDGKRASVFEVLETEVIVQLPFFVIVVICMISLRCMGMDDRRLYKSWLEAQVFEMWHRLLSRHSDNATKPFSAGDPQNARIE